LLRRGATADIDTSATLDDVVVAVIQLAMTGAEGQI
jgi:hypothetical protein